MKTRLWLLLPLLALASLAARADDSKAPAPAAAEPTAHQKLYYFEHRLMPKWTHQSGGAFYNDLRAGQAEKLREVAEELGGADFAKQLTIESVAAPEGVLLGFAAPTDVTDCFFTFVAKVGERYRYLTFEKTEDILGDGLVACIGEWTAEGSHRNFGFSKAKSREAFLKAVADLLSDPDTAPGAETHPSKAQ